MFCLKKSNDLLNNLIVFDGEVKRYKGMQFCYFHETIGIFRRY